MTTCEVKYAPKKINDVVFNNAYYEQQIKLIFKGYKTRHLFLSGTNGNGKSTLADLIANELTNHCPYLLLNDSIEHVMSQSDLYTFFMNVRNAANMMGAVAGACCIEHDEHGAIARAVLATCDVQQNLANFFFCEYFCLGHFRLSLHIK